MNNIVIASGSFKDVYNPIEACELIKNIIQDILPECRIVTVPMVDGGEYSSQVLSEYIECNQIRINDIINPEGVKVSSHILPIDEETVFISSSDILRLDGKSLKAQNPLYLTSFGFGQLIVAAMDMGFKNLILGMGGTSTADAGIGMAQAIGVEFFNPEGQLLTPTNGHYYSGQDLLKISEIQLAENIIINKNIKILTLCDAKARIIDMDIPTNQKISSYYDDKRDIIVQKIHDGIARFAELIGISKEKEYFGTAGSTLLGLTTVFDIETLLGVDYFSKLFNLEKYIRKADLVLTGEGKIDNSLLGKTPIGVSRLARKYNKKVLYVTGTVDDKLQSFFTTQSFLSCDIPENFKENGVSSILSGHSFYNNNIVPDDYSMRVDYYKKHNPDIFQLGIKEFFDKWV